MSADSHSTRTHTLTKAYRRQGAPQTCSARPYAEQKTDALRPETAKAPKKALMVSARIGSAPLMMNCRLLRSHRRRCSSVVFLRNHIEIGFRVCTFRFEVWDEMRLERELQAVRVSNSAW